MRFAQDSSSRVNVIRGYGDAELRVNDEVYGSALIVGPNSLGAAHAAGIPVAGSAQLQPQHAAPILALDPELVLLGTGMRQVFPEPAFGAQFLQAGIGFEVMDTGAACRTFNVLVGEQRRVIALLLL